MVFPVKGLKRYIYKKAAVRTFLRNKLKVCKTIALHNFICSFTHWSSYKVLNQEHMDENQRHCAIIAAIILAMFRTSTTSMLSQKNHIGIKTTLAILGFLNSSP